MNTRQMQCVIAVAEQKSFTKAAKTLYMSQPSLSLIISKLEDELGVALFDRSITPIRLTYAGELFFDAAKHMLTLDKNISNTLRDISLKKRGRIRIGTTTFRAAYLLPIILRFLEANFPNVIFEESEMDAPELARQLYLGNIDIAIHPHYPGVENEFGPDLYSEIIYRENFLVVGSKNFIQEKHLVEGCTGRVDIKKIGKLPLIIPSPAHYLNSVIQALCGNSGVTPNIIRETDSSMTTFFLAASGLGVTIAPEIISRVIKNDNNVPLYYLGVVKEGWDVTAYYRKNDYFGEVERCLISAIRATNTN